MATELATDIIVNVGDVKFYLHKVMSLYYFGIYLSFRTLDEVWMLDLDKYSISHMHYMRYTTVAIRTSASWFLFMY